MTESANYFADDVRRAQAALTQKEQGNTTKEDQSSTASEEVDGVMKDFYSSATGLSGLENKTADEIYDAVNKVLEKMRGCADQFKQAYEEKYKTKLERLKPYGSRSQESTDRYEDLAISHFRDRWENVEILWEESMRLQLDPDQIKHIYTRA